jgi:hypothetical protein
MRAYPIANVSMNDLATLFGLVFGVSALVLGVLNYLRDKSRLSVSLRWDMKIIDNPQYDEEKSWGVVTVTNIGRRAVYVDNVGLILPKKYGHDILLIDSLGERKLGEGDPPLTTFANQAAMEKYAKDWRRIRAVVVDSTGKTWHSKRLKREKVPSWARKGIG